MIITCASCLTKYRLDDSRISPKGSKVRCSRCHHVFYVVPPPETKEEVTEQFESFAKYHKELISPEEKGMEVSSPPEREEEVKEFEEEVKGFEKEVKGFEEEEERFPFEEPPSAEKREEEVSTKEAVLEKEFEPKPTPPMERMEPKRRVLREKRSSFRFVGLVIVIALFVFGLFYLWSEFESGGRLSPYLNNLTGKITGLWNQILGIEKKDLILKDLNGYEEKVKDLSLFVIEGKVENQSSKDRKHVKVKVVIFDQLKKEVASKETFCGRTLSREEWKVLPSEFFEGDMSIHPNSPKERLVPAGKSAPFMVVFKDIPPQAKEFKVEIVEAPMP